MIGKMSLLVRGQAQKRIILSLVFLCFISIFAITFIGIVHAQSAPKDPYGEGDPTGGNAESLYSSFSGTQDVSPASKASKGESCSLSNLGACFVWAFNVLLYAVFKIVALIVVIAGLLFDWAVNAENFKAVMGMKSIQAGWIIFRDFLNIFFILILLFSAFCTIFQVSKYHIKNILLTLVIMALLVNFSFPVSRMIIDAGNIPMYHFLTAIGGGGSDASISKKLWNDTNGNVGMQQFLLPNIKSTGDVSGSGDQTMSIIAAIIFVFLFGLTLLVMAVLLIIRLLVLALLVMASPVGFVGAIFPSLSKYSTQWWEQLFKQSFFGTIMAFMLYISLTIMEESQNTIVKQMGTKAAIGQNAEFSSLIVGGVTLAIPIILLWIAMISAQKMGAAGASAVVGQATKVAKWPAKMMGKGAKWGIKAGAKKFERDILAPHGLSPRAFIQGWKDRAQDAEDKALKPATGAWRDRLNSVFSGGKQKTHYKDMEEENLKNKELKEMESYATNDDYLIAEIKSHEGKKDSRSQARVTAAVSMLYRNNDQNEFMKKVGIDGEGGDRDPLATRKALAKLFRSTGMNENQVGRNLYQLGEIGLSKGNYSDYGMGTYNDKTGKYEENDDLGQVMASTAKFVNVGSQEKMKSIHWNSILTETKKGETGGVHESGKSLLKKMTMAEVGQANRTRPDFTLRMLEGEPSIKKFANSSECTKEERDNILGLMDKIRENYEGKKDDKSSKKSESKSNADQEEANRKNMEEKMSGENKII